VPVAVPVAEVVVVKEPGVPEDPRVPLAVSVAIVLVARSTSRFMNKKGPGSNVLVSYMI
jgi:hypothetical protein